MLFLMVLFLLGRSADFRGLVLVAHVAALLVLVHRLDVLGASHDWLGSNSGRQNRDQRCL